MRAAARTGSISASFSAAGGGDGGDAQGGDIVIAFNGGGNEIGSIGADVEVTVARAATAIIRTLIRRQASRSARSRWRRRRLRAVGRTIDLQTPA